MTLLDIGTVKTDSIFYRLFQEFPSTFFELIGNSPTTANNYQFSSVEVKQTALRIDGVFLPQSTTEPPIYFVEVQFQADETIYSRLIAEICLYLRQNQPRNNWNAVILYPRRSIDIADTKHYREFFTSQRIRPIYLDELGESRSLPIGIATIKLIMASPETAMREGRELIHRTKQEINSPPQQQQLLQLIETILVYKLPRMSREEIEAMFGLSELKQTRVYQEAFQEGEERGKRQGQEEGKRQGKLESIPRLLAVGLTVEQIAAALELSVEDVRQATQQPPGGE